MSLRMQQVEIRIYYNLRDDYSDNTFSQIELITYITADHWLYYIPIYYFIGFVQFV